MRAVTILALAVLLCTAASATVTAPATQDQAKALKDTWPACSQIVKGRLGSLSSLDSVEGDKSAYVITATVGQVNHTTGYVTYQPCQAKDVRTSNTTVPAGTGNLFVSIPEASQVFAVYATQSMIFSMPSQKNDVAKFINTLVKVTGTATSPATAVVTTNCAQTADGIASLTGNYSVTTFADGSQQLNVLLTDINACPRFPYTNSAMPSGAIAALIIILACFVIEFGICGWYHKTHKDDRPITEMQME